jgi:hypothetical protein
LEQFHEESTKVELFVENYDVMNYNCTVWSGGVVAVELGCEDGSIKRSIRLRLSIQIVLTSPVQVLPLVAVFRVVVLVVIVSRICLVTRIVFRIRL